MKTAIVIPARFASTRLHGKPLADIWGKPMIQHVHERATEVTQADMVVVATDDERVAFAVRSFGGTAVMTSPEHASGTDRLVEVMRGLDAELYVNLQGDEPLVRPADIDRLIEGMKAAPSVQVGTFCHAITREEAADPNMVKVVLAHDDTALYFSRSPIPYERDAGSAPVSYLKHVGVYAYRREVLTRYSALPASPLEAAEKLEQLRLMSAGIAIRVWQVEPTGPGVDTQEGLETVRALMKAHAGH
ncbi:MAG: 3-deoxy-D-manno-octulosonate cytidylyltransferase [Rhizobacter sp.]|nr:3-deoxy-D-manno-octulosonate cytidylyltransferase [Rhizobacter sp.]